MFGISGYFVAFSLSFGPLYSRTQPSPILLCPSSILFLLFSFLVFYHRAEFHGVVGLRRELLRGSHGHVTADYFKHECARVPVDGVAYSGACRVRLQIREGTVMKPEVEEKACVREKEKGQRPSHLATRY